MNSGNRVTASGFVLAAGEGQALWFPGSLTVTNAGGDLRAMPSAGQMKGLTWAFYGSGNGDHHQPHLPHPTSRATPQPTRQRSSPLMPSRVRRTSRGSMLAMASGRPGQDRQTAARCRPRYPDSPQPRGLAPLALRWPAHPAEGKHCHEL